MRIATEATETGGSAPPVVVKVWDPFVRLFHWSLVGLFALAYATGDEIEQLHIAAGYAIAVLVAARIVWGFVGPRHARFADFVRPPREVFADLRELVTGTSQRRLGHTPAGAAMILTLIVTVGGSCVTGYLMTTDAYWGARWVEQLHAALAHLTVALIALHVAGVILVSFTHRENLAKAMLTGEKREAAQPLSGESPPD
ncbi:MAG TPA: cytochrome b/b6 domain-containing protein [Rhodopseudomonas sp.]|uniref:cytochrome b/b6 domain-containing protein n=1 Tax=Rhodopseudomonas sp. TaxID=1078 RepID=UPI002ED7997C